MQRGMLKKSVSVASSAFVAASIARPPTNLFLYHPLLAAAIVPLGTASVMTVRSRIAAAKGADRPRAALEHRVKLHFGFAMASTFCAIASVACIFLNKNRLGKPHLASLHARTGALAVWLWLASLIAAEIKVWAKGLPGWRPGRGFSYNPRFLWASKPHRQLGTAGYAGMLAAVFTGVATTPYGATLPLRSATLVSLGLAAIAMLL